MSMSARRRRRASFGVNRILLLRVTLSVDREGTDEGAFDAGRRVASAVALCDGDVCAPPRLAGAALVLALSLLAACGPNPAGSGGLVGHMAGTSDVAGQTGDPDVGGGVLAVIPIVAMDGPFWDLTGEDPVANPLAWSHLTAQLSQAQVARLGGELATIEEDGDFRVTATPGEYAVCYWHSPAASRIWVLRGRTPHRG